jgi:phosphoribosylaminoimidazole (AIR) synthetase
MDRTFNCGVGYVVVTPAREADSVVAFFNRRDVAASVIGIVRRGPRGVRYASGGRTPSK